MGRTFVDQKIMRDVEKRLKTEVTGGERARALDGGLTKARGRDIPSSETGNK